MPRPTQPILNTGNITDAALDAVDATGDFTMPGIAKQLNVTPSSLYTHISGRSEIVELMRIRVMSSISVPEPPAGWSERISAWGWAYRRAAVGHWRLIPLLMTRSVRTEVTFDIDTALVQAFSDGGFDSTDARHAISTLDSLVLGSVVKLSTPDVAWTQSSNPSEITREATTPLRTDDTFDFGLRTLIAGWMAQRVIRLYTEPHSDFPVTSR